MQPVLTAKLVCWVPMVCVIGAWLWSSLSGAIDWCLPFTDGCVSISRAARSSDGVFLFRAGMIFIAAFMVIFWLHCYHFLQLKFRLTAPRPMLFLGAIGALFLVLYAVFLGTEGQAYRLMRRYGVIFYFTFTVLAQFLYTRQLWRHRIELPESDNVLKAMLALAGFVLLIGLISLGASMTLDNPEKDYWENTTEWWFALAMTVYFGLVARLWQQSGFHVKHDLRE